MKDEKPKIIGSYEPNSFCAGQIIDSDGIAPTFLENHGSIMAIIEREDDNLVKLLGGIGEKKSNGGTEWYQQDRIYDSDCIAAAITTHFLPYYTENKKEGSMSKLRIRKLTPLTCMKLMGFEEKDYQAMRKIGMTDGQIEHCAGDSIVTTCLIAIFGQMLFDEETLKQKIENSVGGLTNEKNT